MQGEGMQGKAARGICYGRLDVAVAADAVSAAAEAVRQRIPATVLADAPIYSSPASRCAGLAVALAGARAVRFTAALLEMDFGRWEGRSWDAIPRAELDDWARDLRGYRPGGGESVRMLATRWRGWLESMLETGCTTAIVITHAGVIRVALDLAGRLGPRDIADTRIEFASIHCLDIPMAEHAGLER
jgi:alpha-ribazole phosphatase